MVLSKTKQLHFKDERKSLSMKRRIERMRPKQRNKYLEGKPQPNLIEIFKHGDLFTRLSFLIMGISNLARKQIIKGCAFLAMEFSFILYIINIGLGAFSKITTLGDVEQHTEIDPTTKLPVKVAGDNSMKILFYAVVAIFVIGLFLFMWRISVRSGYEAQCAKEAGKKPNSFFEDIKSFFDAKVYRTLLTLPVLGVLIFNIIPLLYMILIAFTNYDQKHQPPGSLFTWVGLTNFKKMLSSGNVIGNTFWPVLGWTITWAIFATFLNYIFGMILAVVINRKETKCKAFWRTCFVMSIAVPQFVSLLVIKSMLQETGAVNVLLQNLGFIDKALPFFTNPTWAKVTCIVINLWVGVPYSMLITTGVLQNIPSDLYESAKVDGATAPVMFFKITLPYMLFITTPYLITQFVGNLNNFNVIYFLSAGNPLTNDFYQAGHTDLLVTWLYKLTVNTNDYSYAAVIGILVFVLSAAFSLLTFRRTNSYKNEEAFQ